jgi:hypothetical protein
MFRPTQRALLGLMGVALLGQWVVAGQPVRAATAHPPVPTTSYIVQPDASQAAAMIKHGYFTLTLKPGQTQTVRIVVKNTGKQVLQLSNYAADATQIAAGGIDFGTRHKQLKVVGTWITVTPKDLSLAPGEARRVRATITMPKNVRAGDYVGGVALENKITQQQGAGSHLLIDVHYRKVIAILDSVQGIRTAAAKVAGVALYPEPKGSQAVVSVRNTGNILFKGKGTLELLGSKGAVQSLPFKIDTILPSAVAQIPLNLPNITLRRGTYGIRVYLNSVHNVSLAHWQGKVGFMLPVQATPTAVATNVVLQPAQQAATATAARRAPGAASPGSQPISPLVWGGGAVLLLIVGAGLGVVVSRRSGKKPIS